MNTKILAGTAKGRALLVPATARPTPVRVRKSLFDLLVARNAGPSFLDLYAGAGTVGLEAASQGFVATLVEVNQKACGLLRQNAHSIGVEASVVEADARRFIKNIPASFDVVFIDPPYDQDIAAIAQLALCTEGLLAQDGVLIVQTPTQLVLPTPESGWSCERRVYGSNALTLYEQTGA
jgi:16S rRNA (guanine966-N2)-methyltransferase